MTATQGIEGYRAEKRVYKSIARDINLADGEKPPFWMVEYMRMRRRERTEYERDARYHLTDLEDKAEIPDGGNMARGVIIRMMVEQATSSCTAEERELLYLVYFEGVSLSAISRESGIPYRTLGYRLNRTLGKCRRNLEPWRMHRHDR